MNLIEANQNINLRVVKIENVINTHRELWNFATEKPRKRKKHNHYRFRRGWNFRKKLENLGIREGVIIKKLQQHAFKGPIIIEIGNTSIAIGRLMAAAIKVEEVDK